MTATRTACATALLALLPTACSIPQTLSDLERESPPPAHGRPKWVRTTAQVGATVGAVVGGVVSLVFLPITWPISLAADEPLGVADDEFVFMPVSIGAGTGHFLLGAPADLFDYTFRRAWVGTPRPTDYDFTPQPPPQHRALVEAGVRDASGPVQDPPASPPTAQSPPR